MIALSFARVLSPELTRLAVMDIAVCVPVIILLNLLVDIFGGCEIRCDIERRATCVASRLILAFSAVDVPDEVNHLPASFRLLCWPDSEYAVAWLYAIGEVFMRELVGYNNLLIKSRQNQSLAGLLRFQIK